MSPDTRISPISPVEAKELPGISGLVTFGVADGICLYNPPDRQLLDFDLGQLESTKAGAALGISPKKPLIGNVSGWEVTLGSTDPQKKENVFIERHTAVNKEEEHLRFRTLWFLNNGKIEEISARFSGQSVCEGQEVAFFPVPSQNGKNKKDGGVLIVSVNDLLKPHFRKLIESFLSLRQSK